MLNTNQRGVNESYFMLILLSHVLSCFKEPKETEFFDMWGTGLRRIMSEFAIAGLPSPEISERGYGVSVKFRRPDDPERLNSGRIAVEQAIIYHPQACRWKTALKSSGNIWKTTLQ